MSDYIVILCTVPSLQVAEKIAQTLVPRKLAACVNIVSGLISVYWWKGEICREQECLLIIKSRRALFPGLKEAILSEHPYEVPEIVTMPIEEGHQPYLDWIEASTIPSPQE
ncbi:MAG: divalent-cation tolerance protein CutA [Spirochaetes bacterium]|nr:MAG: divalent-cation tolerance protein CutA [Spirochaetota bacterium]